MGLKGSRLFLAAMKVVNVFWVAWILFASASVLGGLLLFDPDIAAKVDPLAADLMLSLPGVALVMPAGPVDPELARRIAHMAYLILCSEVPFPLLGLHQLRMILENTARQSPFATENANRIRVIGLAIIGWAVLASVRGPLLAAYVMSGTPPEGFQARGGFELGGLLKMVGVGVIVLLVAEVFRYGMALQEEHDLTV